MGALSRFEDFFESLLEGSFTRILQSPLQPVELARHLEKAMESQRTIGVGKVYVPNEYRVLLSAESFAQFEPFRASLERELAEYLVGLAHERGYTFIRRPVVTVESLDGLGRRQVQVLARLTDYPKLPSEPDEQAIPMGHTSRLDSRLVRELLQARIPKAAIILRGQKVTRFELDKSVVSLGRALDNDVVIEDPRVSRYHAEIRLVGSRYVLVDLKSTNGSRVNGELITQCALAPGDLISLGGFEIVFQLLDDAEPAEGT